MQSQEKSFRNSMEIEPMEIEAKEGPINDSPNDILFSIFNKLGDRKELLNLSTLSRKFNIIVKELLLCTNIIFNEEKFLKFVREMGKYELNNKVTNLTLLGISFDNLKFIENFENIVYLELNYNKAINLNFVSKLNKLKSLYLSFNALTQQEIEKLNNTSLESLDLSYIDITNLDFIKNLPKLKAVRLSNCQNLTQSELEKLEKYELLEELDLSYTNLSDISFIGSLKNLKRLTITNLTNLKQISEDAFINNQLLKELNIPSYCQNLTFLKHLPNLKVFSAMYCQKLTQNEIEKLKNNKLLEELNVSYTFITNIDFIKELPNLQRIWIFYCIKLDIEALAKTFSELKNTRPNLVIKMDNIIERKVKAYLSKMSKENNNAMQIC
ncbi:MAG: hypothetical protein J0H68_01615 [Sphingobacteriia bacterium]|nr:hypothetical protein [Sphingobacteriia bacterium]